MIKSNKNFLKRAIFGCGKSLLYFNLNWRPLWPSGDAGSVRPSTSGLDERVRKTVGEAGHEQVPVESLVQLPSLACLVGVGGGGGGPLDFVLALVLYPPKQVFPADGGCLAGVGQIWQLANQPRLALLDLPRGIRLAAAGSFQLAKGVWNSKLLVYFARNQAQRGRLTDFIYLACWLFLLLLL